MVTRAGATVAAPPSEVWGTVADPHHLPRWWPMVERVEDVDRRRFTEVLRSRRGALVRADFVRVERVEPRLVSWSHQLEGTPFARFLSHSAIRVTLEPCDAKGVPATRVTVEIDQRPLGKARFGGLLFRRAARRQIREALATLRRLHERP